MKHAIWWLRRDLRLHDNQALTAALQAAEQVLPVFILDPALLASPYVGQKRQAFLWACLAQLDADLRQRGSRLIVRQGPPAAALSELVADTGSEAIFAEPDYSPYARRRDASASSRLPLHWAGSPAFFPPGAVLKADGKPYTVFTPFSKAWQALPRALTTLPAPAQIPTPPEVESLALPAAPALAAELPFPPGEAEALRRLQYFTQGQGAPVYQYRDERNRMDLAGTSQLSPYFRFGLLSARQALQAAEQAIAAARSEAARANAGVWLNELIWREFFIHILYHFPHVRQDSFQPALRQIAWANYAQHFAAWCAGQTGYPVVDAAMRQLLHTGWMHNRARMIVASFLTKDLLIDWRWGERWFMQHLVDGDPAANNGGWQWSAGTGTDAAPYFRIFNPVSQGQKFDPQGDYIRLWLPELRRLPLEYIHEPWRMPAALQTQLGCRIGTDYPAPIVVHGETRQRTLDAYAAARGK